MRALPIAVLLVGCGGGPSVEPVAPRVEILSSQCSVQSGGFLIVDVDYNVTLDFDQAFEATVNTGGAGSQVASSYTCGSWGIVFLGNENRGCERDQVTDTATQFIEHTFNANLPDTPVQFSVSILGSALDTPLSDIMLANASESVTCSVPSP